MYLAGAIISVIQMKTVGTAFYELRAQLTTIYDDREAAAIAHALLEHLTGMSRMDRLVHKERLLVPDEEILLAEMTLKAVQGVPMQYITKQAWFMGQCYFVDNRVLIPRPETEELVQWIVNDCSVEKNTLHIVDVGTGSGCIPISLKLAMPRAEVTSCDVSENALAVAHQNAQSMAANVTFLHLNFLEKENWAQLPYATIVVSNPPYIPLRDAATMHINVRENEPAVALFVPDEDALIFYRALAVFGRTHLQSGGRVYCEMDAAHAEACRQLFVDEGYNDVIIRRDMHGNDRMLRATR